MSAVTTWSIAAALAIGGAGIGAYLGGDAAGLITDRTGSVKASYASLVPNPNAGIADSQGLIAQPPRTTDYGIGRAVPLDFGDAADAVYVVDAAYEPAMHDGYRAASLGAQDGYRAPADAALATAQAEVARYAAFEIEAEAAPIIADPTPVTAQIMEPQSTE